jgi:mono/diheme cytochrome c family protein
MRLRSVLASTIVAAAFAAAPAALSYPGGTPTYQTDAAPFCAACHASTAESDLAGAPADRASKELAEDKHLALIRAGAPGSGYESLSQADRDALAAAVRAVDAASTVKLEAPTRVKAGETFKVTVRITGGDGPAAGVALVDANQRWFARPAGAAGWQVVAPPEIKGPDGKPQTEWLSRRPEALDRNLSFVNVTGIHGDAAKGEWSAAEVVFTLRAPQQKGRHPLAAAYLYGTEMASPLGVVTNALGQKGPRGGMGGHSGRVRFTPVTQISVE